MQALRGIDLDIDEGEFVAIMGPSGSGKSTCMNILGCLDTPTAGSYRFKGVEVGSLTRNQRALLRRHYQGFVFQGYNLLNRTSALENVELPLIYRGASAAERRARAREALETVGLKGWESHTPGELSGGQQQRVAIARAIVTEPAVLLADEPTGNLDTARSREIMELLTALNRDRGITIIMVTHEPDMAAYATRIIRFMDGLVASDQPNGREIVMIGNTVLLALREIRRNVLRSFLTILGIVIGVAAVITMVTIGGGATLQVRQQIASMGSNLLMVSPGKRMGPGQASGASLFKEADAEAIAGRSAISPPSPRSPRSRSQAIFGNQNWSTTVTGTDNRYLRVTNRALQRDGPSATANCAPARRSASWGRRCARNSSAPRRPWGRGSACRSSPAR